MAPTPSNGYTSVTHSLSQEREDGGDQSRRRLSIDTFVCVPGLSLRPIETGRLRGCLLQDSEPLSPGSSSLGEDEEEFGAGSRGCETPKGKHFRLPMVIDCPPAPRKPRAKARRKVAVVGDNFFTPDYSAIDEFFSSLESKLPLFKK